jgi:hypothetical protein
MKAASRRMFLTRKHRVVLKRLGASGERTLAWSSWPKKGQKSRWAVYVDGLRAASGVNHREAMKLAKRYRTKFAKFAKRAKKRTKTRGSR